MKWVLFITVISLLIMGCVPKKNGATGDLTWNFNDTTGVLTISGEGAMPDYIMGSYAPWHHCGSDIVHVNITEGVESIGNFAFVFYSGLTSINIPNSVTSIGDYVFVGCSGLTSIAIPNRVTSIGNNAFEYCSGLTSISIPNGVTSIGRNAFRNCRGLIYIDIPNSITSIGYLAFENCSSLEAINMATDNSVYSSADGVLYNKDQTTLLAYPGGKTDFSILCSVTHIGNNAFRSCGGLTSVTIGNSVTSIGGSAFYDCINLTSVTIGNSVTCIGSFAFRNCKSLTSVTIGSSVTKIGDVAFILCNSLTSITVLNPIPIDINSSVFREVKKIACTLIVPESAVESYRTADVWKEFEQIVGLPNTY